ncbi:hypothetical protein HDC90_003956 [Pedobacter sp. AK013]|nr:hypothetical protein [Pedobacter sp. AK013]
MDVDKTSFWTLQIGKLFFKDNLYNPGLLHDKK